jgi:hypothetical protein
LFDVCGEWVVPFVGNQVEESMFRKRDVCVVEELLYCSVSVGYRVWAYFASVPFVVGAMAIVRLQSGVSVDYCILGLVPSADFSASVASDMGYPVGESLVR